jgi:hypothetical protein
VTNSLELRNRLANAGALADASRRRLTMGEVPDFGELASVMDGISAELDAVPRDERQALTLGLLALIDRLTLLIGELGEQQAAAGRRLQEMADGRKLRTAYAGFQRGRRAG